MATSTINILEHVQARSSRPWILDHHGDPLDPNFTDTFVRYYHQLQSTPADTRLLIADPNPVQFLAKFLAACASQRTVFLGNAKWVQSEWRQAWTIAHPTQIWITPPYTSTSLSLDSSPPQLPPNAILIPTGGTSGVLRFAIHTWDTLSASVAGFREHFQVDTVNTCCVLPLYHVSGLMQFMRSFLSGGDIVLPRSKDLEQLQPFGFRPEHCFLSLVPTQLARLCNDLSTLQLLQSFQCILLGGAPPWPELLEMGRRHHLPLAPTYGMTETASQVATLRPQEFLQSKLIPVTPNQIGINIRQDIGARITLMPYDCVSTQTDAPQTDTVHRDNNAGAVLPHANITIRDPSGKALGPNQTGLITIQATSLAWGYCSKTGTEWLGNKQEQDIEMPRHHFHSNDLGFVDDVGHLHVVGRQQDMIISGGENIVPTEVEAAIRWTGLVDDVAVVGVSDRLWGEAVTAIYVPLEESGEAEETIASIKGSLAQQLNRIKHPKYWISVSALPCNAQGKVNRSQLKAIAHALLQR